jgi:hypothetical protein
VSWQASLANSAVTAAEDVRSAVRAARTAENAKAAASAAAMAAQHSCESGSFVSIDEARAAQTRASIAQSHAFHAAVVEHEAKAVKRRATLALANDVKCWNVHRKREMLKACIAHARSQHEATRRAVDAWSCLRDGYIGSTVIPSAQPRKFPQTAHQANPGGVMQGTRGASFGYRAETGISKSVSSAKSNSSTLPSASSDTDFLGADFTDLIDAKIPGVPIENLDSAEGNGVDSKANVDAPGGSTNVDACSSFSCIDPFEASIGASRQSDPDEVTATIYQDLGSNNNGGDERPVIVAVDHNILACSTNQATAPLEQNSSSDELEKEKADSLSEALPFSEAALPLVTASPVEEATVVPAEDPSSGDPPFSSTEWRKSGGSDEEIMSASMQSLVDGLMAWGGQFDADDVLALPTGMAASIAFEGASDTMNAENTFQ